MRTAAHSDLRSATTARSISRTCLRALTPRPWRTEPASARSALRFRYRTTPSSMSARCDARAEAGNELQAPAHHARTGDWHLVRVRRTRAGLYDLVGVGDLWKLQRVKLISFVFNWLSDV